MNDELTEPPDRQWLYQTCVEFGYFWSTNLKNGSFAPLVPIQFFINRCRDIFGPQISAQSLQRSVDLKNNIYGGRHLRASNIVYPNGSVDPIHFLGILQDLPYSSLDFKVILKSKSNQSEIGRAHV